MADERVVCVVRLGISCDKRIGRLLDSMRQSLITDTQDITKTVRLALVSRTMSVVKTSEGRVGRWVLVTVVTVGLAGVTGWMLATGDRGVQVAAVLGFPIAVLGVLVAAVGLLLAIRANPIDSGEFPGGSRSRRATPSHRSLPRWSLRGRIALAGGLVAFAVLGAMIMLIDTIDSSPGSAAPRFVAPSRFVVPNLREADPCRLIDPHMLDTFGAAQHTTPPWLESCEYTIKVREGGKARLRVQFRNPGWGNVEYTNRVGKFWGAAGCESFRKPADNLSISITTFTYENRSKDLCSITTAITTSVEKIIDDLGGIPATPNRTSGYSHASHNACDTLDNTDFGKYGLAPAQPIPGFANWTCFWDWEDGTNVGVLFGLGDLYYSDFGTPAALIGTKETFHDSNEEECVVYVVHQPRDRVTAEMFHVSVEGTVTASRCDVATALATTVEANLS